MSLLQVGQITVGTSPVQITFTNMNINLGMRLLARLANTGNVYFGTSSGITTTTGSNLVCQGAPGTSNLYTVPADHFQANGQVWLVADGAGQIVDWSVK